MMACDEEELVAVERDSESTPAQEGAFLYPLKVGLAVLLLPDSGEALLLHRTGL